jgi:hypothetical protein
MPSVAGGVPGRSGQTFRVYEWGCRGSKLQGGRQVYFLVTDDPGAARVSETAHPLALDGFRGRVHSAGIFCEGQLPARLRDRRAKPERPNHDRHRMSRAPSLCLTECITAEASYAGLPHGHPHRALGAIEFPLCRATNYVQPTIKVR